MGINLSGILGGASALDRELNAKAKGTREAGAASSALDQALAKAQQDKAMSALDMELKGAQAAEHRARAASLVTPKKKYTHLPVTVDGKATMAMQDEDGNIVDARTKQPLAGDIQPFAPPGTPLPTTRGYVERSGAPILGPDGQPLMPAAASPPPTFTPVTLGGGDGAAPVVQPFNTRTGTVGTPIGTAKPTADAAKLTEPQEKSHLFYKLMADAEPQIDKAMRSGMVRKAAISAFILTPSQLKPLAQSGLNAQEQSLIRSFKDFAAGVLRKESGAAVTPDELREVWDRYGPGFGDDPSLDVEKSTARQSYMATMKQQAGPALKFYESQSRGRAPTTSGDAESAWAAKHPPHAGESFEQYHARFLAGGP